MLQQLEIQNIALIDNICIELGEGLNILTGETGAGKSIIIDSINAILGERISKDLIRTGTDRASIQAVLKVERDRVADILENAGIEPEEDDTLIISREFNISGKNNCRINGRLVTASLLKEIGERIIDIHGQYDNQSLLKVENHIELLDSFGGERIDTLKHQYNSQLAHYKAVKSRIKALSGDIGEREKKIDLFRFQIDEIRKSKLKAGEEEELAKKRELLVNSEKIVDSLSRAYELLYSGNSIKKSAYDVINEALYKLDEISELDDRYENYAEKLRDIYYQVEDLTEQIRKERDGIEFDQEVLEKIDERIDILYKLKRKYGNSVEQVLEYCEKTERELEEIIKSEETVNSLLEELSKINTELFRTAGLIHSERVNAARVLESKIGSELGDLEMKRAQFEVEIKFDDESSSDDKRKFTINGLDRVEFLISPNVGEPLKSLSKIASGGEMSRIMLAIKTILANVDRIPTLIFDEIDIGVSGKVSQRIGEKLSFLSKNHQVICVTHLAQIACMADNHFLIEKISDKNSTRTLVKKLQGEQISNEIARIIGGATISDITRSHAEEMLSNARKLKNA